MNMKNLFEELQGQGEMPKSKLVAIQQVEKNFRTMLEIKFARNANDEVESVSEYIDNRIYNMSIDELIELANEWGQLMYMKGKFDGFRE